MADLWDELVGVPISRWACARSVREIRHYIDIRDGKASPSERVTAYPDGHWPQSVDQLGKAFAVLISAGWCRPVVTTHPSPVPPSDDADSRYPSRLRSDVQASAGVPL